MSDQLDVVVIGAGQAGLALGWHLRRRGISFTLLDAAPAIGHSWATRWDSLTLFTPAEYSGLPGMPFPPARGSHPTKDEAADYLRAYAEAFALPVRLGTHVDRLSRDGSGFVIESTGTRLRARQVVVATGPFQRPAIPAVSGGFDERVVRLHSSAYRNPAELPGGPVLVVGAGNSGLQVATELARTRQVHLAVGSTGPALPQRLLGRDLFWWLTRLGLVTRSADTPLARRTRARGELVIGSGRRRLGRLGVVTHPRLVSADGASAGFADGTSVDLAAVVWATGFRPDYSWIDVPGALVGGRPRHARGVTDVEGLCFLGLPWQHSRGSSLMGYVGADAGFIAEHLVSRRTAAAAAESMAGAPR
jgi:putative flavoprotein involved in K+ transport